MSATAPPSDILAALPHLRRYARVLTGETPRADALVAETLDHAARNSLPSISPPDFLRRLFALMHQLHFARATGTEGSLANGAAGAAPDATPPRGKPAALLRQFGKLPTEEREVLLLVAVERMHYDEIASVLRVPVSTVMARLKRARDQMRAADLSLRAGRDHA